MKQRAIDAILLRPAGSPDGAFWALNAATGQRVQQRLATAAHMTPAIIRAVEDSAKSEGMPEGPVMLDRAKVTIMDIETDSIASVDDNDGASDASHNPLDDVSEATETTDNLSVDHMDESVTQAEVSNNGDQSGGETQECDETQEWETQQLVEDPNDTETNVGRTCNPDDIETNVEDINSPPDATTNHKRQEGAEIEIGFTRHDTATDTAEDLTETDNLKPINVEHPDVNEEDGPRRSMRETAARINAKTFEPMQHH